MDLPDRGSLSYAHMYRGRDGRAAFVVMWLSGPTYGESDVAAVNQTVGSFFTGFGMAVNARIQRQEPASSCELQNQKDISMRGFTGLEFETSCTVPARARVFTRLVNGDRQMYLAIALYMEKDDNINRFINSFTITPPAISRSKKK